MLKKSIWSLGITLSLVIFSCFTVDQAFAEGDENLALEETGTGEVLLEFEPEVVPALIPVISGDDFIEINKKSLFDAADSSLLLDVEGTTYIWNFGDGKPDQVGKEIIYDFAETGSYTVTLKIKQGDIEKQVQKNVFVYNKKAVLITDSAFVQNDVSSEEGANPENQKLAIADQAARQGVWLSTIIIEDEETAFLAEEKVIQQLTQKADIVSDADYLIFYTKTSLGLQGFARYWQNLEEENKFDLNKKSLIKITDDSLEITSNLTQQSFNVIKPNFILVTRKEAINPIFELQDNSKILQVLDSRAVGYKVVDERSERSKLFVLSTIITGFIAQGIPPNTIYLILAFPFAAFFVAFARQFVGLSTFGVYTPLMLVISFLILGVNLGLSILFVVILISYTLRKIFNKVDLLYIPRVSLMFSFISLSFLITIWFILKFSTPVSITLAIFPMLVMSTMSEKFVSVQSEEGMGTAMFSAFETIIIAVFSYYFLIWSSFADLLMSMPELILLPLIGNFILGKFSGLRLTEYFRFRMLFKENIEE